MPNSDYFSTPGLSNSGMSDLAISPMRYWYKWVRPDREPEEPTPYMVFGSALHCAVLEPDKFPQRYARELDPAEYDGLLRTMDDLRSYLAGIGIKAKGTRKAEVIAQVLAATPDVPILDVLASQHAKEHEGKEILSADFWTRINQAAEALRTEPVIQSILSQSFPEGRAEHPITVQDPETGVPLKGCLDWITPTQTLDIKTFTVKYGKSVDKAVADAIWYEQYYRQAYFYCLLRALSRGEGYTGAQTGPEFILAFVESEPPYEVRLKAMRPKIGGQVNLWWERARVEVRSLIAQYDVCMKQFGTDPWRTTQDVTPLYDEEMKGLAY